MMQALLGAGASALVMTVAIGLQWGLFLPLAWLLGPIAGLGLTSLWLAMGGYRLLQALVFTVAWQRRGWAKLKV
jgi:Na+-driven multidrug efflux pump